MPSPLHPDFYWGTSTSSHQIEGAWLEGGKGLSTWDAFSHTPGKIHRNENADIACDHYHRYETDVALMAQLGVRAYRFSIAWARIIPDGTGAPNPEGIAFYNRLIDALLAKGITPFITLYHWDLPLTLQLEHDGWLSYRTAEAFAHYAKICYDAFSDRVKHWVTFNENWCSAVLGHGVGVFAPGRKSDTEPYLAAHNLTLAHGLAVQAYRKGNYGGVIGIANNCDWREPLTDSPEDRAAAQEALEFFYGWFADPVIFGDYPDIMKQRLGDRLPRFTDEQKTLIKGSADFLGLNHYTTHYASRRPSDTPAVFNLTGNGGMSDDQQVSLSDNPAWLKTSMGWNVVPFGLRKMLGWIAARYGNLPLYVTENGCSVAADNRENAIDDTFRVNFINDYTNALLEAIHTDGLNIQGYFCWSLLDNFEWTRGYDMRFGIVYNDFKTQERTPKASFHHYARIIKENPPA